MRSSPFARRIDESQAAPPTAETVRKSRHDVVARLYRNGGILTHHLMAAEEIRDVYEGLQRAMFRSGKMEPSASQGGHENQDWLVRMNEELHRLWLTKYAPWSHQMAELCGSGTTLQLVIAIVVDNYGVRIMEESLKIRRGSAVPRLRASLERW